MQQDTILSTPPCMNCVTLPICKTLFDKNHIGYNLRYVILLEKCSLLNDYVYGIEMYRPERLCYAVEILEH